VLLTNWPVADTIDRNLDPVWPKATNGKQP
jgi:hypothetical protein